MSQMKTSFDFNGLSYIADLSAGVGIARWPEIVDGAFDLQNYAIERLAFTDGSFIGDVSKGGSCNVDVLKINPHCGGTHTETLLHILDRTKWPLDKVSIASVAAPIFIPAVVLTIEPMTGADTIESGESYQPEIANDDLLITAARLRNAIAKVDVDYQQVKTPFAIVIRTANDAWAFGSPDPLPYFTTEAMALISDSNCQHLLVDFPSIDRSDDGGQLSNHHRFWQVQSDLDSLKGDSLNGCRVDRTITEMVTVPSSLKDGVYLLDLQIAPLQSDATLSRPVLFAATA